MRNFKRCVLIHCLLITQFIAFFPFLAADLHSEIRVILPDPAPVYRKCHALIIGINRYPELGESVNLRAAVNDAEAIQGVLEKQYGYHAQDITLLINKDATKESILNALEKLKDKEKVSQDDSVIFYFAGHHFFHGPEESRQAFLVPFDGKQDPDESKFTPLLGSFISNQELLQAAQLIPARHKLFIIDSGYAVGSVLQPFAAKHEAPTADIRGLEKKPVLQFLTAGRPGEPTSEFKDHSYFCWFLLDALQDCRADINGDGYVLGSELAAYITGRAKSYQIRRCVPPLSNPLLSSMGSGDFILRSAPLCYDMDGPPQSR